MISIAKVVTIVFDIVRLVFNDLSFIQPTKFSPLPVSSMDSFSLEPLIVASTDISPQENAMAKRADKDPFKLWLKLTRSYLHDFIVLLLRHLKIRQCAQSSASGAVIALS